MSLDVCVWICFQKMILRMSVHNLVSVMLEQVSFISTHSYKHKLSQWYHPYMFPKSLTKREGDVFSTCSSLGSRTVWERFCSGNSWKETSIKVQSASATWKCKNLRWVLRLLRNNTQQGEASQKQLFGASNRPLSNHKRASDNSEEGPQYWSFIREYSSRRRYLPMTDPWDRHIFLREWLIFMVNVGL